MNKLDFLLALHDNLTGYPQTEVEERLKFYEEMIEDRMEDGLSEEAAVAAIGTVDEITAQIISDIPFVKIAKDKVKPNRKMKAWEIILLILGAPVWLPILISLFAVVLSLYISIWSVVISLWAAFVSVAASGLGAIAAGIIFLAGGHVPQGIAVLGAALVCIGLSVFIYYGCLAATKGTVVLLKKLILWTKKLFAKKEGA